MQKLAVSLLVWKPVVLLVCWLFCSGAPYYRQRLFLVLEELHCSLMGNRRQHSLLCSATGPLDLTP